MSECRAHGGSHRRSDGGASGLHQFDRIIASLHDAMLDRARWRQTSALIDDTCGVTGTHLRVICGDSSGAAMLRSDRRVVCVTDLYTERELRTLPTYEELRRAEARDGRNIGMGRPHAMHLIWAVANPIEPDRWSSERTEIIKRLMPHLCQFVRIRQALIGAEALRASVAALLDNMMIGAVCLNWLGMIVQANSRAKAILENGDGLISRDGVLRAHMAADDEQLSRLVAHALPRSGAPCVGGSMTLARSATLTRLALHVAPVAVHDAAIDAVAALVLIVDPDAHPSIDPERVAEMLGLTPAESRIAAALAEGATVREIAMATRRAESTVRDLLKHIHVKLGVSRRADLVRRVLLAVIAPGPR